MRTERSLYPLIGRYFNRKGMEVAYEVKSGKRCPRRFDIVAYNSRTGELITVEVKLSRWKQALDQVSNRLFFSDYVYLALPTSYLRRVISKIEPELKNYGIGLLSIDGHVSEILRPMKSRLLNPHRKSRLLKVSPWANQTSERN